MSAILHIPHPDITNQPRTTFSSTYASGGSTLPTTNSSAFTSSKYVLITGFNTAKAEIRLAGTVTSTTIPVTVATSFEHPAGDLVYQLPYNQIEITYSTDFEGLWDSNVYATIADAAAAATWSTLSSGLAITPEQAYTTYKDDSTASRTYRWRYKNSTDTIYSDYINYQFPDGFEEKSVAAIIRKATTSINKKVDDTDGSQVTSLFCYDTINECLRDIGGARKRWSHDQNFNGTLGDIVAGTNGYVLPSNIEIRDTRQSIWNVRIDDQYDLDYIDKREYDLLTRSWHTSDLTVQLTSASTTATFTDTSNFDDDGSFSLWVSGTQMTVNYTANNRTTNVLTLTDAATDVTATAAVGTPVWQGASFGTPAYYTVFNGKIYFDVVPSDAVHARTIGADYYLKIQQITGMTDYIRENDPNLIINWLRWAILMKTNNEQMALTYHSIYASGLAGLKKLEYTGQKQYLRPPSSHFGLHKYRNNSATRYYGNN